MPKDAIRRMPRLAADELALCRALADEDDLTGMEITGEFSDTEYTVLTVRESRLINARFTASTFTRTDLIDCVLLDCDFSGATWEHCQFERVEFRHCRMSGIQAPSNRFHDVAMIDCKLDGANFRMSVWERGELRDSHLVDADFYGARLPSSRIQGCDLSNVEFSKCDLTGSQLQRSRLDGIRGGDALRGVTIGSEQLIPAALALFGAVGISIRDEE